MAAGGKRRRAPARRGRPTLNPVLLAIAAVAVAFGGAYGVSALLGAARPAAAPLPAPVAVTVPVLPLSPPPRPQVAEVPALPDGAARVPAALPLAPPLPPAVPPPQPPSAALPPWLRNAVPAVLPPGRPVIAVVIDDMGLDRKRSARAARLPAPLTLSWLPYAPELTEQVRAARAAGHEMLLHLPMEPVGPADPGPNALKVSLDATEIARRLDGALASFDGYVGVNNHMGSRFTADRTAMGPVLAELRRRGLLWLDSRTTARSVGMGVAQELGMPHIGRDIFLDNDMGGAAVRGELARLETVARRNGQAVAIGHPHDATLDALEAWLPQASSRGFALAPLSALVKARAAGG